MVIVYGAPSMPSGMNFGLGVRLAMYTAFAGGGGTGFAAATEPGEETSSVSGSVSAVRSEQAAARSATSRVATDDWIWWGRMAIAPA